MNTEHRYIFEKGSKKHLCPDCGKRRFVRYVDTETGNYLPEQYGRCDRESKCSYFLNPYQDGYAKAIWEREQGMRSDLPNNWKPQRKKPRPTPAPVFFDFDTFKQTLAAERYEQNTFIQNLFYRVQFPFEVDEVTKVVQLYRLGTVANGYRAGAITFPFIDVNNNVRAVQVKQFDEENHTTGTDFLHSIIEKHHTRNNEPSPEWLEAYKENETKVSCLFGEHLLSKYPYNPVALVEAPKSAIYGTLYFGFPDKATNLLWLAVYNLSSLNLNKCKALKGRNVYLFPDLSKDSKAFDLWSSKAEEIQKQLHGSYFQAADFLEQLAPQHDKAEGNDIADYLITKDWRLFREREIIKEPQPEPVQSIISVKGEKSEGEKKLIFLQPDIQAELPTYILDDFEIVEVDEPTDTKEWFSFSQQPKPSTVCWLNELAELETFFTTATIPTDFKLNQSTTIIDPKKFIKSHAATLRHNNGKRAFEPYFNRLVELKSKVE
jgi:hypothetical protein